MRLSRVMLRRLSVIDTKTLQNFAIDVGTQSLTRVVTYPALLRRPRKFCATQ